MLQAAQAWGWGAAAALGSLMQPPTFPVRAVHLVATVGLLLLLLLRLLLLRLLLLHLLLLRLLLQLQFLLHLLQLPVQPLPLLRQ